MMTTMTTAMATVAAVAAVTAVATTASHPGPSTAGGIPWEETVQLDARGPTSRRAHLPARCNRGLFDPPAGSGRTCHTRDG
ncbi:hypothetical protein P5V15_008897 [Pogonomyrmex californicus]